jgi:DNA (cytosine-5)-methyltransferase 1
VSDLPAGPRIGSLCTGYGGLDLAVELVLGGQLAWYAETDRHAQAVLAARWPGVPNLGDIRTVDWASVEPVDVLTAGFPCQDYSE